MLVLVLTAGLVSLTGTLLLTVFLPRWGMLDVPNARSSHVHIVPRGGGIAVLAGLVSGLVVSRDMDQSVLAALGAALLAAALGLVDDWKGLPAWLRFLCQVLLSIVAVAWAGVAESDGWLWAALFAFLWIAFVNAFNFMDGINGISALVAIVSCLWFVTSSPLSRESLAAATAASAAGFLLINAGGHIFLGDVGSYILGSLIWSLAVSAHAEGASIVISCAPMLLYGIETLVALLILIVQGARPGEAHRLHAYQRLVDSGVSHLVVAVSVAILVSLTLVAVHLIGNALLGVAVGSTLVLVYIAGAWMFSLKFARD